MTIKDLTEKYDEGVIVLIDDTDGKEACICEAHSVILSFIEDKEVISWRARTGHSKPKIEVRVALS